MSEDTTVSQYTPCKLEMTKVCDFVVRLARAGKARKKLKLLWIWLFLTNPLCKKVGGKH